MYVGSLASAVLSGTAANASFRVAYSVSPILIFLLSVSSAAGTSVGSASGVSGVSVGVSAGSSAGVSGVSAGVSAGSSAGVSGVSAGSSAGASVPSSAASSPSASVCAAAVSAAANAAEGAIPIDNAPAIKMANNCFLLILCPP